MKNPTTFVAIAALAASFACKAAAAETDPISVVQNLMGAMAAQDVITAEAIFTDNAGYANSLDGVLTRSDSLDGWPTSDITGPASLSNTRIYQTSRNEETMSAQNVVIAFLKALENKDMAAFAAVWTDDAVQEMPYAPPGFPKQVAGKSNIISHYSAWPDISGEANFTDHLVSYPMADPDWVFVEYQGRVEVTTTGRIYAQQYGGLFHVTDGKIKLFREYFNPAPFVYAFDLGPEGASALGEGRNEPAEAD